jgi:cbb3-type cytochrome oxidase maturation protein
MEMIYFLLPLCVVLALGFVAGFFWMTKNGQYDDMDTPAKRMLLDDLLIDVKNINPSTNDVNKDLK